MNKSASSVIHYDSTILQRKIYSIRGTLVMFDRELAELFHVKAIRLREQVKRNIKQFPNDFMFQLTQLEVESMVSQNAIPSKKHLGGYLPYVFTEQGVANLASVLNSSRAIEVNIQIMRAFVAMSKNNVAVTIFTKEIPRSLSLDIVKFNSQYQPVEVKIFKDSHGRFMVIDNKDVFHFGASLKELGKKWFAFSKFDKGAIELLRNLNEKNI